MKIINLFYLIFLLCPITMYSQNIQGTKITIKGTVLDSLTNEVVPYATLRITTKDRPDVLEKAAATDDNGKFSLTLNKRGDFVMNIQYLGKDPLSRSFTIKNENLLDFGKVLLKDSKTTLSEVVVSAQRPLVKVDLDKITYSLEDDPDSKTSTLMDMLKKVPMITVDAEDKIELKGSSSYKIYMDGKPSSMLANNPKDILKSMPASSIKNIEVITDPGPKYDAEGLAGIINIITNKQSSLGGYTATVNSRVDTRGGYGLGAFLTMKKGKIGFTGNYNYYNYKSPWADGAHSSRENFQSGNRRFMESSGRSKFTGDGQYGGGELSYEIDTLNLINIGFDKYGGDGTSRSRGNVLFSDINSIPQQEYQQATDTKYTYGTTSFNIDYQRTSAKNKNRMTTVSYRFESSPNDWASNVETENMLNYLDSRFNQNSDGSTKEHTFQLDYTTPFAKIHTLEAGLKYIIRLSDSNSGRENYNFDTDTWTGVNSENDKFKHRQDIYSAYLGYSVRLKKWSFKTGLRYEGTSLDAKFPLNSDLNFKTDYSDIVPSATVSYQIKPAQTLRLGYNMRISRPGIWQLNPYVNRTDTNYISFGNPDLDAVKSHNMSLNYSFFSSKFNLNSSLSYDIVNNSIENITEMNDNVVSQTYANIGKRREVSFFNYVSWSLSSKIRFTVNASVSYLDIRGNGAVDEWMTNNGFSGRLFTNLQYTLPKDFKLSAGYGGMSKSYTLLGTRGGFSFHSFSLAKSFLSDKLTFNVAAVNPFQKELKFKSKERTRDYVFENVGINKNQSVNFSVSYRFGEMKSQIKKALRSINNDDAMSGGGASNGSGGRQQPTGN